MNLKSSLYRLHIVVTHIKCEAVLNLGYVWYAVIFNVIYGRERFPVERKIKLNIVIRMNESRCQLLLFGCHRCHCWCDGANKFQCDAITYQTSSYQQFLSVWWMCEAPFIHFFFSFCNLSTIDNVLDLSQRHHVRMLSLYVFVCLFVLNMNARVVFFSSFLFLACLSGASLISICVKYYFFSLRY